MSATSIVFVALGLVYGVGFLIAAWVLVTRLIEKQSQYDEKPRPGTYEPSGNIATPVSPKAATKPKTDTQPPISEPIDPSGGFDGGGVDG